MLKIKKHRKLQAEHDTLTELLNRGSYEKVLAIYEKGEVPFAFCFDFSRCGYFQIRK